MNKIILSLAFLLIVHFSFNIEHCFCQWYPLPVFPSYLETTDVKFFDENTGVITYYNYPSTYGILRTTNGGMNWTQIKNYYSLDCQKIDSSVLYILTSSNLLLRTFNKGATWDSIILSGYGYNKISFVNKDTGWVSGWISGVPYIWRTTNGGINFTIQAGSNVGAGEIFFYNKKVNGEYIGWVNNSSSLWKTTNSGNNWFQVACPGTNLNQVTFINENTGWVCNGQSGIFKTINGGFNWVNQSLAPGIPNITRAMFHFKIINKDTIYASGGDKFLPNLHYTALIWKTTNGGDIWGYQEIDSSYHIGYTIAIDFINENTGWAFEGNGLKTTNGGGQFTSIHNEETIVNDYKLFQNYPNPFNQTTNIKYQITNKSFIILKLYDITGKEVATLVNEEKPEGKNSIRFDSNNLPSGIYFYQLMANGIIIETKKMILLK